MRRAAVALLALAFCSCSLDELDLEGRECPCIDGWVCDTARNVCVEGEAESDAGPPDMDAGPPDDDAGPPDMDAGPLPDMDAGPGSDGGTDAGSIGPPSRCVAGDLGDRLFCESFEGGDMGNFTGQLSDASGNRLEYVQDVVYRGNYALRATVDRLGEYAILTASPFDPSVTDIYFRAYYYFSSGTEPSMEMHYLGNDAYDQWASVTFNTSRVTDFHTHGFPSDFREGVSAMRALDTWHCVELHMRVGTMDGSMELWFDGVSIGTQTMTNTLTTPPATIIGAGLTFKDAGESERFVYVDEVVADTSRIGCDP